MGLPDSWEGGVVAGSDCAAHTRTPSTRRSNRLARLTPVQRWIAVGALAVVLLIAVLAVGSSRWWFSPDAAAPADDGDPLVASLDRVLQRRGDSTPGVAIRPLAGAGSAGDAAALADGVCAALAERLARLPALRVVPCRSTGAAAAVERDDRRLARLLAVRYVITGRVEPRGDQRVHVHLTMREANRADEAWRIDEELPIGNLQALPARVAEATGITIGRPDPGPSERLIAPNLYAKFVRARELAQRVSVEDRLQAVALLDEVIAGEPDHGPALYLRQNLLGGLLGNMPGKRETVAELNAARAKNVAEGLALAERLVHSDPLDYRGQVLLLAHEMEVKQWPQGFDRLDRILERHSRVPGLLKLAARLYLHAGYLARARELALAAAQLNALDAEALEILAAVAGIERRDGEFRELLALALQIGHGKLGPLQVYDAHRRSDWAELERVYTAYVGWGGKWPTDWVAAYARGHADPSQRDAALRLLDEHDPATRQHFSSFMVEYALLGDPQRSLRSVRHHAKMAPASWMQYLWWPELAAVRWLPGFAQAMTDLGAVALWQARGAPELCSKGGDGVWACR
jgi:TolB-like protein